MNSRPFRRFQDAAARDPRSRRGSPEGRAAQKSGGAVSGPRSPSTIRQSVKDSKGKTACLTLKKRENLPLRVFPGQLQNDGANGLLSMP